VGTFQSTGMADEPPDDGDAFNADFYGSVASRMSAEWGREDAEPAGDLTPAEVVAYLSEECPGLPVAVNASQFIYANFPGDFKPVEARYEAKVWFPNVSMRYVKADSFRGLADLIVTEYRERQAIARRAEAARTSQLEAGMSASA
jgi:hypothetical protein